MADAGKTQFQPLWQGKASKRDMIDIFSLLLSHGLLLIASWRLLSRPELDDEVVSDTEESPAQPSPHEHMHGNA